MEILAVDDRCDVISEFREGVPPLHLLGICCRSPCHVVDRSYGNASGTAFGSADQIDHRTGSTVGNSIAESVSLFSDLFEAQDIGQQGCGTLIAVFRERYMVKAAHCVFGRYGASLPYPVGIRI